MNNDNANPRLKRNLVPWLFLAPALVIFTWFKFIPMLQGLVMSFYKVNFNQPNEWVGFANFSRAFGDEALHSAVFNTLLYVLVTMVVAALSPSFWRCYWKGRHGICVLFVPPSSCPQ